MIAWLESRVWQVGAIAGAGVALGLAVTLGVTLFQKAGVERDLARTEATVERLTGDLRACRSNARTLEDALDGQNDRIVALGAESAERLAAAEAAVAEARSHGAALQSRLTRLLTAPAAGATTCERIDDIDRAVLEAFR